jgi:hypothetical protein
LQAFAHLKTLTLVRYGKGYPEEMQAKVKALLPPASPSRFPGWKRLPGPPSRQRRIASFASRIPLA